MATGPDRRLRASATIKIVAVAKFNVVKMSATRSNVLKLYKTMLRESLRFPAFNFRKYALRRIRDSFKANKDLKDCDAIESAYKEAFSSLALIKRQVVISEFYKGDKLVLENIK